MKTYYSLMPAIVLLATISAQTAVASPAAELFKKLDTNGDGVISMNEAESRSDIAENFADGDVNNDGKLDMAEFEAMDVVDE
jgi:Ca2+-binding EF-hand superfamily protein